MKRMTSEEAWIDPHRIEAAGAWLFWSGAPDSRLTRSLEQLGQLEPVLAAEEGGGIRLVSGYKRLLACKELGRPVWVRFVVGDDFRKGRLYLHANLYQRPSGAGLVSCARFFQTQLKTEEVRGFLEEELRGFVSGKVLDQVEKWLFLEGFWVRALKKGRVPFEAGPLLASVCLDDRESFISFFESLSWSWNKARNFLTWTRESAKRDRVSTARLVQREGLLDILQKDLSPNDMQKHLLQRAYSIRYPVLAGLEQGFKALQDDLGKKSVWRILPEQHFEANGFTLQTRIRERTDLDRALEQLQDLRDEDSFDPIWQWQRDNLG
ncbi:MAG: ParB/RepB/Spo0J family partition protein [Desulfohalobiaceae bacterium]|nr:ParB/RepB/Spo0J family partition protein [Desulfohalobiaceae bacterium]